MIRWERLSGRVVREADVIISFSQPACTDKGVYEKGAVCAPVPCPKASPQPCIHAHQKGRRARGGGGMVGREFATQEQIRDWEDDFDHEMASDYAPNVFDHEPRPTTWQT